MAVSTSSLKAGIKKSALVGLFTNWLFALALIFCFAVAIYYRALSGASVSAIHQQLTVQGFFRPLTSLSYLIDSKLFGSNAAMWHLDSIVIHALTAVAITCLAWTAIGCKHASVLSGLFFAVQPAQVGAVLWLGGRADELSALFVTLYLFALVKYFLFGNRWMLVGAAALFFVACATKEVNIFFLAAAPIFERAFGDHSKSRAIRSTGAMALAAAAFGALWLAFYPHPHAFAEAGPGQVGQQFLLSYFHYASLLFLPNPRALTGFGLGSYSWIWLIPAVVLLAATPWILKKTYEWNRRAGAFLLTFLVAYLPVSNLMTFQSAPVAPYRVAGGAVLIALLLGYQLASFASNRRKVPVAILGANLLLSFGMSWWAIGALSG